jgi:hypothetical protein
MSLIKKSDVKNHMRPPFLTKIHLCRPESQPDATGYSVPEPGTTNANRSGFSADFVGEHSSPGASLDPANPAANSIHLQPPTVSKSAQA